MDAESQSVTNSESASRLGGEKEEECSVCVAVNIRPLIGNELVEGCRECLTVEAQNAQVTACGKNFLFDRVYGSCNGSPQENLFGDCVQPLVDALFKGYNATVLAYGQTGSGKTYTMGSAFTPGEEARGVIPSVLDRIFERIKSMPLVECTVRASFVEIHKEEIRDLLVFGRNQARFSRTTSVSVREVQGGGVCLSGATEREVTTKEQTSELLAQGTQFRATASTNMNSRSSRSHAIFTITLEQRKQVSLADDALKNSDDDDEAVPEDDAMEDFLTAKMHLVDLAGSERAKRTKAEGQRLKEGIDINKGLLALGKVISSLVDHHRHVPYRDSKLTRLLQDSLGGNSRTVMIACVSPADINLEESMNTLRYANRARNIKNKPVVNRDPVAAQLAYLRQQLAAAKSELAMFKKAANGEEETTIGVPDPYLQEELERSERDRKRLENEIARLEIRLESAMRDAKETRMRQVETQCTCDKLKMTCNQLKQTLDQLEQQGIEVPEPEETMDSMGSEAVIHGYLDRIAELEEENQALKDLKAISEDFMQRTSARPSQETAMHLRRASYAQMPELQEMDQDLDDEERAAAEEQVYEMEQKRLDEELSRVEKSLEMKEMQIQKVEASSSQVEAMRQQFEKQLRSLDIKKRRVEHERQELAMKLQNLKAMSHEEQLKLEEHYRHQLKEKDEELKELKKKEKEFAKLEKLKRKTDDACSKLRSDVERIKAQKVKLHRQIDLKNKEHQERMKTKDREMMRLKKESRATQAKLQKIEALHNKQQTVLRRKTEEAEMARKRLKELSTSSNNRNQGEPKNRRAHGTETPSNQSGLTFKDDKSRLDWLEHELDGCNQSLVMKRVLDGEMEQRKHASRQLHEINMRLDQLSEATVGEHVPARLADMHQNLLNRKNDLESKIAHHSGQIAEVQKMYEQARSTEERTGAVTDMKRWNSIRTVTEARGLLKTLFKFASDQKVQANEFYNENAQLTEESAQLQDKLEIMTQEVRALRKNLVKAEAAALAAVSLSSKFGQSQQPQDKSESEVEELLQQINSVATNTNQKQTINILMGDSNGNVTADKMDEDLQEQSEGEDDSDDSDWAPDEDYEASPNGTLHKTTKNAVEEKDVLNFINTRRARRGEPCAQRLTVPIMENELQLACANSWHRGKKPRDILVTEIRTRLMTHETGLAGTRGDWSQNVGNICIGEHSTPQAKEFMKNRDKMLGLLERVKSRPTRRANSIQRH